MSKSHKIVKFSKKFMRSINLEKDFHDTSILSSLIITEDWKIKLNRIIDGLRPESGQRAWRIMGDYGSGKSAFALLLAHTLFHNKNTIPKKEKKLANNSSHASKKLFPLLIVADREPLTVAIQRCLAEAVCRLRHEHIDFNFSIKLLQNLSAKDTIQLLKDFNDEIIVSNVANGSLLIIDELGKSLEFAAQNPTQSDVYFMQGLAEYASRSGNNNFVIIGILHQGFSSYTTMLTRDQIKEWDKVAGRYGEIIFDQSILQISTIITKALNVDTNKLDESIRQLLEQRLQFANQLGWYGSNHKNILDTSELASAMYPFDPLVIPVLIRFLKLYGQNSRSVFNLIFGNDPFGLQYFLSANETEIFQLWNLYDYVRANFEHTLRTSIKANRWAYIQNIIESFTNENPLNGKVLKTIGILNFLNCNDLIPTNDLVVAALTLNETENNVKKCLKHLQNNQGKKILHNRGLAAGLSLWSYTSIDIEDVLLKAEQHVHKMNKPIDFIQNNFSENKLIARRHYICKGTLRYFQVNYLHVNDLNKKQIEIESNAEGKIFIVLCDTLEEQSFAENYIKKDKINNVLWLLPNKLLPSIQQHLFEYLKIDYAFNNTLELNNDFYAKEALISMRIEAMKNLENSLKDIISFNGIANKLDLRAFHLGEEKTIHRTKDIFKILSDIFDNIYTKCPLIKNELINRKHISSAAASARLKLINNLLTQSFLENIGMTMSKRPPEVSMYLSIIKQGLLHIKVKKDKFQLAYPTKSNDPLNFLPSFKYLEKALFNNGSKRKNLLELFNELKQPPFGIRDGLIYLLFSVFYMVNSSRIAFYEDDCFLSKLESSDYLRLIKCPETFECQYCSIEGVRKEVFHKISSIINLPDRSMKDISLLEVVRPLCIFVAQLPEYVHNTTKLSKTTIKVRKTIFSASDPIILIFAELPKACGLKEIDESRLEESDLFISKLQKSIDELRSCYHDLLDRVKFVIKECFNIAADKAQWREQISSSAIRILSFVSETKLKAFCLRLSDTKLSENEWLESIASLVTQKQSQKWSDSDEDKFLFEMNSYVRRFQRVEETIFDKTQPSQNAVRICFTNSNGEEIKRIVEKKQLPKPLEKELSNICKQYGEDAILAMMSTMWDRLKE